MSSDNNSMPTTLNAFAPGVAEKIGYYVYLLIDPRDNVVFYVGKGSENRCFAHLTEARKTKKDEVGDYAKLARICEIEATGKAVQIHLLRHGVSEREAFLIESSAIDLLENLTNRVVGYGASLGRMSVMDINALYGATSVEIDPSHRVALIRINRLFERGMTDEELYEATRKWWRIDRRRHDLDTTLAPEWAMAVFGGVVRAVYRIEAWEQPTDEDIAIDAKRKGRSGFSGKRDFDMEARYLHRDVSSYLRATPTSPASQTPVRYVNCSKSQQACEQRATIVININADLPS
jgi:uncharacterized protein